MLSTLKASAKKIPAVRSFAKRFPRAVSTVTKSIDWAVAFTRWLRPRSRAYRHHPFMHFEAAPGYDGKALTAAARIRHNGLGFRGPMPAVPKPQGTFRIVCMGESTTYCEALADDETYPAQLEREFRKRLPGRTIEVVNAGVAAYTSAHNIANFVFKVQGLQPDLVVYYYTINDIGARELPVMKRDYDGFLRREPVSRWSASARIFLARVANYHSLMNYFFSGKENGAAEANILSHDASVFELNMTNLAILVKGWGGKLLLVNPRFRSLGEPGAESDTVTAALVQHRAAIERVADRQDALVLDLLPLMPKPPFSRADADHYYSDSIHFTAAGADLIARHVADAVLVGGLVPDVPEADRVRLTPNAAEIERTRGGNRAARVGSVSSTNDTIYPLW